MQFHANHGCFKEEEITGNAFIVDLQLEVDTSTAQKSDDLNDTLDYQSVYLLVKAEMAEHSALLEHVAQRILTKLHQEFKQIEFAEVCVSKMNPPLGGQIGSVSVTLNSDEL